MHGGAKGQKLPLFTAQNIYLGYALLSFEGLVPTVPPSIYAQINPISKHA